MAIPNEILKVERPKGTIIKCTQGHYYVVKRTSVYKDGRRVPVNVGTVGKIIDMVYVPYEEIRSKKELAIDILNYGTSALFHKCSHSLLDDLKQVYEDDVANKIYTIALIRAIGDEVCNRDLKHEYDADYISKVIKNVSLSESSLPSFFEKVGMSYNNIERFMKNRVETINSNITLVDGTLKSYNSIDSTFSEWSRKGKTKGSKDFSLLYSYDLVEREPLAAVPYTGNMLDSTSFVDFASKYSKNNQFLVLDKGFWQSKVIEEIKDIKGLKYLVPIKNNSKLVGSHNMLKKFTLLENTKEKNILCNKVIVDDKFYYVFKNLNDEAIQHTAYLNKNKKNNTFNFDNYSKKKELFGVIIFESNVDSNPFDIYEGYKERWNIETMFNFYKNILDIPSTLVKNDCSLYTTEFINYLSLIMGCKVKKYLHSKNILNKYSFKQVMRYLRKCKKVSNIDQRSLWIDNQQLKYIIELRNKLGI